ASETQHLRNPFDVPGAQIRENPHVASGYIEACLHSEQYDAVVVLKSIPGAASLDYLRHVYGTPTKHGKPVIVASPVELPLEDYGLPIGAQQVVGDETEPLQCAEKVGYPVVAKLVTSARAVHKTELGGVYTNLRAPGDLAQAVRGLKDVVRRYELDMGDSAPL